MGQFLSTATATATMSKSSSSSSSYEDYLSEYLQKLNASSSSSSSEKFIIERIVSERDADSVVPIMAKSFALGPCPMHDWAIGPEFSLSVKKQDNTKDANENTNGEISNINTDTNENEKNRVEFVAWYMKWVFYTCINYGIVLVAREKRKEKKNDEIDDNDTTAIRSVVCALPPEYNYVLDCTSMWKIHVLKLIVKMMKDSGGGPPANIGTEPQRRMDLMGEMMAVTHKHAIENLNSNKLPWYIFVIATDPTITTTTTTTTTSTMIDDTDNNTNTDGQQRQHKHQGKGYATALLNVIHALADYDHVDTLLETNGDKNIQFYCRPQLGYTKLGTGYKSSDLPTYKSNNNDKILIAQSLVRHPCPPM